MKRATISLALAAFLAITAGSTFATAFYDMEKWNYAKRYAPGDIIVEGYDIYVGLRFSRGRLPSKSKKFWKKADISQQLMFKPFKLYWPGEVVSSDERYFLARRISVLPHIRYIDQADNHWLEFTHPALVYNVPPNPDVPPELDSLLGTDNNSNGIRDDFEHAMAFSNLPNPVILAALDAGKIYGRLMTSGTAGLAADHQASEELLLDLIRAEQCRREMTIRFDGKTWSKASYFNSVERIEVNYKLQNALSDVVDVNQLDLETDDPCADVAR